MSGPMGETGAAVHRAHSAVYPMLIVATGFTCVRDQGLPYAIGSAAGWLLLILFVTLEAMHHWDACTMCHEPPRRVATPEARARLARRVHKKWIWRPWRWLLLGLAVAAVAPKPYLKDAPWWTRAVEAAVLLSIVTPTVWRTMAFDLHKRYASECHVEVCRAGEKAVRPGKKKLKLKRRAFVHYAVWALPVAVTLTVLVGMLALKRGGWLEWLYSMAALSTLVLLLASMGHGEITCFTCAKRISVNGGELAERRMRWLRLWHQTQYPLPAVAFAAWVISWAFAGTAPGRAAVAAAGFCMGVYVILQGMHSRVKPWCPWCRDDGGEGAEEDIPDPSRNAPVPV